MTWIGEERQGGQRGQGGCNNDIVAEVTWVSGRGGGGGGGSRGVEEGMGRRGWGGGGARGLAARQEEARRKEG